MTSVIAVLAFSGALFAENKNMVSIGAGNCSLPWVFYRFDNALSGDEDGVSGEEEDSSFVYNIAYDRILSEKARIGVIYNYEKVKYSEKYYDGDYSDVDISIHTLLLRPRVFWGGQKLKVYHGFALGGALYDKNSSSLENGDFSEDKGTDMSLALHGYLIGLEYKFDDNFCIYADLGLGWLGTVNYGISFCF